MTFDEQRHVYPTIVMEFLPYTLLQCTKEIPSSLTMSQLNIIFFELADVVSWLHDQRISHNDLKPQNIMLTEEKHVKLIDFGLSKTHSGEVSTDNGHHESPGVTIGFIVWHRLVFDLIIFSGT